VTSVTTPLQHDKFQQNYFAINDSVPKVSVQNEKPQAISIHVTKQKQKSWLGKILVPILFILAGLLGTLLYRNHKGHIHILIEGSAVIILVCVLVIYLFTTDPSQMMTSVKQSSVNMTTSPLETPIKHESLTSNETESNTPVIGIQGNKGVSKGERSVKSLSQNHNGSEHRLRGKISSAFQGFFKLKSSNQLAKPAQPLQSQQHISTVSYQNENSSNPTLPISPVSPSRRRSTGQFSSSPTREGRVNNNNNNSNSSGLRTNQESFSNTPVHESVGITHVEENTGWDSSNSNSSRSFVGNQPSWPSDPPDSPTKGSTRRKSLPSPVSVR
jgi:hypothetical protein